MKEKSFYSSHKILFNLLICFYKTVKYRIVERLLLLIYRNINKNDYLNSFDTNPLISITIPTYDRGKLLIERTIPSILSQSYQHFEIIIVGDCCPESTAEILSKYNHPKISFHNLSKRTKYPDDPKLRWFISGVDPSNYALKIIKGKWICYFDDDDIMHKDYLKNLLKFASTGDYEFVAGLYRETRDGKTSIIGHKSNEYPEFGGHSTWMYRSYLNFFKYNIDSWRKTYNCPQDIDLQLRMKQAGVKMECFNKVVSYIKPRPGLTKVGIEARLEERKN